MSSTLFSHDSLRYHAIFTDTNEWFNGTSPVWPMIILKDLLLQQDPKFVIIRGHHRQDSLCHLRQQGRVCTECERICTKANVHVSHKSILPAEWATGGWAYTEPVGAYGSYCSPCASPLEYCHVAIPALFAGPWRSLRLPCSKWQSVKHSMPV